MAVQRLPPADRERQLNRALVVTLTLVLGVRRDEDGACSRSRSVTENCSKARFRHAFTTGISSQRVVKGGDLRSCFVAPAAKSAS